MAMFALFLSTYTVVCTRYGFHQHQLLLEMMAFIYAIREDFKNKKVD